MDDKNAIKILYVAFNKVADDFGRHMHIRGGFPHPENYWGKEFYARLREVLDSYPHLKKVSPKDFLQIQTHSLDDKPAPRKTLNTFGYTNTDYGYGMDEGQTQHITAKIATDLKRVQRLYDGIPTDRMIDKYQRELTTLLENHFLAFVIFGFCDEENRVKMGLKYQAQDGVVLADNDPGDIPAFKNVDGCSFVSYVAYNANWNYESRRSRELFYEKAGLPVNFRTEGNEPLPYTNPNLMA